MEINIVNAFKIDRDIINISMIWSGAGFLSLPEWLPL